MLLSLKRRFLVAAVSMIAMAVLGMAVGFNVSKFLTFYRTGSMLMEYATRLLETEEIFSAEARVLLADMNTSKYPHCSDAEMSYFRKMIYRSEYIKDGGHIRDGKIECSATLSREELPQTAYRPDFARWDGTNIYQSIPAFQFDHVLISILQLGNSYVVYSPYKLKYVEASSLHYAIRHFNAPKDQSSPRVGSPSELDAPVPLQDGHYLINDTLYAVRCTDRYFNCVTTYISTSEMTQANHDKTVHSVFMGGGLGACLGLLLSLLYRRSRSMEQQLRRAIRQDKLSVAYQAIIELDSGRIEGAEALARWTDEDGFAVGPDIFIKLAEERGFVGEITRLVVRQVLRDFGQKLRSDPDFRIHINVAAEDLCDPGFIPMLEQALNQAGVCAMSLVIEITESCTVRKKAAKDMIDKLRQRGHSVHIDDFGTGYSSLAYLQELSVDAIKIDKIFTQAIGTEAVTVAILPQILAMAKALHLQVIVEGIETPEQADYFSIQETEQTFLGQGWLFGRPVPVEEFLGTLSVEELTAKNPA